MSSSPIFYVWLVWFAALAAVAVLRARSVAREKAQRGAERHVREAARAAREAARAARESVRDADRCERRVRPAAAPVAVPALVAVPDRAAMIAAGRIIPLGDEALRFAAADVTCQATC
jgi:hypothetical protein